MFYDLLGQSDSLLRHDAESDTPKKPHWSGVLLHQLVMYIFGVVVHARKGSKNDIHLYTWMEHENRKDSNLTASALNHCFRQPLNVALCNVQKLRLFSDSCFGQNKNVNVL